MTTRRPRENEIVWVAHYEIDKVLLKFPQGTAKRLKLELARGALELAGWTLEGDEQVIAETWALVDDALAALKEIRDKDLKFIEAPGGDGGPAAAPAVAKVGQTGSASDSEGGPTAPVESASQPKPASGARPGRKPKRDGHGKAG